MSIRIDKEFESLIPPLSAEEFQQLEENCVRDGIRDALIVWNQDGDDILIDGHNRFRIVGKHPTIQFNIRRMQFADRNEAIRWIILNQFGRRNLSAYDRSVLALKLKPVIAEKAKEQQGTRTDISQKSVKSHDTQKELAKVAGVSHDTIHKVEAIQKSGNEQLIKDIKEGRESINSGYQKVHPKKTPAQSNKEFVEKAEQEHEDFQNSKTVSLHEVQMDKANRQIIASNVYARLLNMGIRINDISIDMEQGKINLKEMCKELDAARIKSLKTTIRMTYEQLMKIDKELSVG